MYVRTLRVCAALSNPLLADVEAGVSSCSLWPAGMHAHSRPCGARNAAFRDCARVVRVCCAFKCCLYANGDGCCVRVCTTEECCGQTTHEYCSISYTFTFVQHRKLVGVYCITYHRCLLAWCLSVCLCLDIGLQCASHATSVQTGHAQPSTHKHTYSCRRALVW